MGLFGFENVGCGDDFGGGFEGEACTERKTEFWRGFPCEKKEKYWQSPIEKDCVMHQLRVTDHDESMI